MWKYFFSKPKLNKNNFEYKLIHSFDNRKKESERVISLHQDKIPIILEKADNAHVLDLDKKKYLIHKEITIGQFIHIIRKKLKMTTESLFLLVNNTYIPKTNETIGDIYHKYSDQDKFLYLSYS